MILLAASHIRPKIDTPLGEKQGISSNGICPCDDKQALLTSPLFPDGSEMSVVGPLFMATLHVILRVLPRTRPKIK